MEENKNQEEFLNDENQTNDIINEEIPNNDIETSDNELNTEDDYTPILGEEAQSDNIDYSVTDTANEKRSTLSMKILIPVIVVIAAFIVLAVMLAANGSKINNSSNDSNTALSNTANVKDPSFKIDGKKVDTDDLVFLKINDNEIGFDELRNCYYQFLYSYGPYYGISEDTFKNASGDDLKSMFSSFKDTLAEYIKGGYVHLVYAQKHNITFDKDDEKAVKERIQSNKYLYLLVLKKKYLMKSYHQTA